MQKQLISSAQIKKLFWNIKLKGEFEPQPPPLRTPLHAWNFLSAMTNWHKQDSTHSKTMKSFEMPIRNANGLYPLQYCSESSPNLTFAQSYLLHVGLHYLDI